MSAKDDIIASQKTLLQRAVHNDDYQLVVLGAFRYALGRMTYIVGSTIDYLRANWDLVDGNGKYTICRDVIGALMDDREGWRTCGMECDKRMWLEFAKWAFQTLTEEQQELCRSQLEYKGKEWPLIEESEYHNHDHDDDEGC